MTSKPVRGITISKDGKIKKSVWYPNASAKIKARKSKKLKPVRRTV